jgi:hypothetical protein
MATRPAKDSDMRYTVMLASSPYEQNLRHDRCSRDHFWREPYPTRRDPYNGSPLAEAACGRGVLPRRVPARSRVLANKGSDGSPP